jgi:GxxExxY protein
MRILTENEIAQCVVQKSLEVHRALGPGLLESTYEECLWHELHSSGLHVERQKPLPLVYKGIKLELGYRLDLLIEKKVIIEVKSVDALTDIHFAQLLTYLRLSTLKLGLLINFNVVLIKLGIRRIVNKL